jgi:hypothetical protein
VRKSRVLPKLSEPIRRGSELPAIREGLVHSVRPQGSHFIFLIDANFAVC